MFVTRYTTVDGLNRRFNRQTRKLRKLSKLLQRRSNQVGAQCRKVRAQADRLEIKSAAHNQQAQRAERMAQKLDDFFAD